MKKIILAAALLTAFSNGAMANSISSWSCSGSGDNLTISVNTSSAVSHSAIIIYDEESIAETHSFSDDNQTITITLDSNYDCSAAIIQVTDGGSTFDNLSN